MGQNQNNRWLIIAIVLIVLCCCCILGGLALFFGYDYMGDPLHIYGSLLPMLAVYLI